ncbi:MAG: hypothetical protein RQ729_13315, partial [Wenzhouxiangellaceae bacterium]|nr:hypothetical protein [Wenzhouxiangellaceae bacterium]
MTPWPDSAEPRLRRAARALLAGTAVGLVVQECLWLAIDAFSLEANLNHALARGRIEDSLLLALALSSFCGGLTGGMMAALLG